MATDKLSSHYGIVIFLFVVDFVSGQVPPCTGQTLGNDSPTIAGVTTVPDSGYSYIFLGNSMKVPCCGVISEWKFATKAAGDLTVQAWRQNVGSSYEVIGEKTVSVTSDNNMVVSVGESEQTSVTQNDFIGWHSSAAVVVPYVSTASAVMGRLSQAGKTSKGSTATWTGATTNSEEWMFGAKLSAGTAPSFGSSLPSSVTASTTDAVDLVLHTLTPTDVNPDDVDSLTITISPPSTTFKYDTATKEVKVASTPLTTGTHEVVFEVVDPCLLTGTGTLTIVVSDNRPNITSLPIAAALLPEETKVQTLLHTLVFTDDGPLTNVNCSMTTAANAPFAMTFIPGTSNYGIYYVPNDAYPLFYDTNPFYTMTVTCNDGTSDSDTRIFQVSIEPNEEPVLTLPANIDVDAETTDAGDVVYTAVATDPENDALTYSMANCSCPFDMNPNGEMFATQSLNTHRVTPYDVEITVRDDYNNVTKTTTITITNINHPPNITNPTQISPAIDNFYIDEHTDEGTPNAKGTTIDVTTVLGFDEDADTLTFEFDPVNGQGEALYNFDTTTGKITTIVDLDYETLSREGLLSTTVYVRAYDGREYSETRILNIIVNDVNETPEFTQNFYAIETGETTGTATLPCALFAVVEEDNYDTRTYDINCGATGHYHIPSARGSQCDAYIVQTEEDDQDNPGRAEEVVSCIITVTDKGGLTATTTLQITVNEEDDNPPVLTKTSYTYTITNDTGVGSIGLNADATDDDFLAKHKRHTYSTDSSDFGVDADGQFFSKRDWTYVNAPTTRTFTLTVKDDAGHTDTAPVTINIIDVVTTTAATTTTTAVPSTYSSISSFMSDPGNLAWLIPAILLGLAALALLGYMCFRCCSNPGACASFGRICRGGGGGGVRRIGRAAPPRTGRIVQRPIKRRIVHVPVRTQRFVGMERAVPITESTVPPLPIKEPPPLSPPPKNKSSIFDIFKKKSTGVDSKPNVPEPINANQGNPWTP